MIPGAGGRAGADRVIEIMQGELKLVLGNCGNQKVPHAAKSLPDGVISPDRRRAKKR